jgi:hypothetical protein
VLKAILAAPLIIALAPVQEVNRVVALTDLTVPPSRLPPGCALLEKSTTPGKDGQVRIAWLGLPVSTNPWTGNDRPVLALIRERFEGPSTVPDGPPLNSRELARFRAQLADGVEAGYAAAYQQSGQSGLTLVQALRFETDEGARMAGTTRRTANPRAVWLSAGRIRMVVSGDGGACFQSVSAYISSLAH